MKYVQFNRGRYIVRISVPPELRSVLEKRELIAPLGTDKKIAERNAHAIVHGFLARIEDARAELEARKPTLSSLAKEHYKSELLADDRERFSVNRESTKKFNAMFMPRRMSLLRLLAAGELDIEYAEALMGYALDDLVTKGLTEPMPAGSYARMAMLRALAEVQIDALIQFQDRDRGIAYPREPKSELLTAPEPEVVDLIKSKGCKDGGVTLAVVLNAFHKERTSGNRSLAEKTMEEHRTAVRMFEEFAGKDIPVRTITRTDLLAYKQALLQTPVRYAIRFPGLSIPQAIRANKKRSIPFDTLDPSTINMKWLSHLSTLFKWALNNGYMNDNPASGVRVDGGKGFKEPSRLPFSQNDLHRIFGAALFRESAYGTKQWALLVALYSGARSSSEIARIKLSDIYEEQGVTIIELSEASKNIRSKRIVPVHDALIKLGFLDYVAKLRNAGKERLFTDWEPEDKINRWFLRSFRKDVGITDRRKVFHSFRHTLKTALARHGVNRDISDLITGHKDQSVAAIYISEAALTMVKAMAEGLNRVKFDLPLNRDLPALPPA